MPAYFSVHWNAPDSRPVHGNPKTAIVQSYSITASQVEGEQTRIYVSNGARSKQQDEFYHIRESGRRAHTRRIFRSLPTIPKLIKSLVFVIQFLLSRTPHYGHGFPVERWEVASGRQSDWYNHILRR